MLHHEDPARQTATISDQHRAMLAASRIADEVAEARGYATILEGSGVPMLARFGFDTKQAQIAAVGGLLIPLHAVDGNGAGFQFRPDVQKGKMKYISPTGQANRLDINPAVRELVGDPGVRIWVVEGSKKADAMASLGECAVSISGVWNWRTKNDDGGTTALGDFDAIALNDAREVIVGFDSDAGSNSQIKKARRRLASFLAGRGARVRLLMLPDGPDGAKQGVDDFLAAGHTLKDLLLLVVDREAPPTADEHGRPMIYAGVDDLAKITATELEVLRAANNPPRWFRHGGHPVRIELDDASSPIVAELTFARMREIMSRIGGWFKVSKDGDRYPAPPPRAAIENLLAVEDMGLPLLVRLTSSPFFAPSGRLHVEPGYDSESRTFYVRPKGFGLPSIPEVPTASEITAAVDALLEVVVDFPFVGEADISNALALLIVPFARELIAGPVPLLLVEKPSPGAGASLLASAAATLAGVEPALMTEARDEDEWRKRITAAMRGAPQLVVIDNLRRRLDSAALSAVLTCDVWSDRVLGASERGSWPVRAVFVATANNPSVSDEIARRIVPIRLDPRIERPWERDPEGFRHPELLRWIREDRGRLAAAALTIIRAWLVAGRPQGSVRPLGSFEGFSRVLGGILDHSGVRGFLTNLGSFYDRADEDGAELRGFLQSWLEDRGDGLASVSDLFQLVETGEVDLDLGRGSERSQRTRLGKLISRHRDRRYGLEVEDDGGTNRVTVTIRSAGTSKRAALWKLELEG